VAAVLGRHFGCGVETGLQSSDAQLTCRKGKLGGVVVDGLEVQDYNTSSLPSFSWMQAYKEGLIDVRSFVLGSVQPSVWSKRTPPRPCC
jgi:hypothetical protein